MNSPGNSQLGSGVTLLDENQEEHIVRLPTSSGRHSVQLLGEPISDTSDSEYDESNNLDDVEEQFLDKRPLSDVREESAEVSRHENIFMTFLNQTVTF